MKSQYIDAHLPLYSVDVNHWSFAGEFNCRNNLSEPVGIKIALKLMTRFPFFDKHQSLRFVEVRVKANVQAARCDSCWTEHRHELAQKRCSSFVGSHDLHRENDQGSSPNDRCLPRGMNEQNLQFASQETGQHKKSGASAQKYLSKQPYNNHTHAEDVVDAF
jgi:hypothetical protein